MNLYQKLAKIRKTVAVIQKDKLAFNYKYVPEDEILARITAGMEKYGVSLIPTIRQGTLTVTPYAYKTYKTDKKTNTTEVKENHELIVSADMQYKWVDDANPDEFILVDWGLTGQQSDSSQAFGSGLTYCQRYFLLKYFQIATVDDDPDNWRSKQKATGEAEKAEALAALKDTILEACTAKIEAGFNKDAVYKIIADNNGGRKNPNAIKDIETANEILKIIKNLEVPHE